VHDGGVAKWRAVKLGIEGRKRVEVLEGLASGEVIVKPSQPTAKLADGRKVQVPN